MKFIAVMNYLCKACEEMIFMAQNGLLSHLDK